MTAIKTRICSPEKIVLLGGGGIGIDLSAFDPDKVSLRSVSRKRVEIGVPDGFQVVGFVGRLVMEKGLLDLFAAARMVRERVPDVCFVFVGPVDYGKSDVITPQTASEYGIESISRFLGMRQDMAELYALMDVFVLPSYREGLPRAPMEASAMKTPVVVTNIRGCRDVVAAGRNGLLVEPGDIESLARGIIRVLTDQEMARRMGEEGRRMALERFDERLGFERVEAAYDRLLKQRQLRMNDWADGSSRQ